MQLAFMIWAIHHQTEVSYRAIFMTQDPAFLVLAKILAPLSYQMVPLMTLFSLAFDLLPFLF